MRITKAAVGQGKLVQECMRACRQEAFTSLAPWCLDWFDRNHDELGESLDARILDGLHIWLAWDGATKPADLVGFAWAEANLSGSIPLELQSLYIRSSVYGTGIADGLLRYAIGDAPAWLWVYETNERAKSFYSRHGFVMTEDRQVLDGEYAGHFNYRMVRD